MVGNEEEARAGVEFWAKRGYEQIKIYNSTDPKLVPVLAREAHARGMGVTGHIPYRMLANEAVRAGYDGIEHINQLMLNFFADHQTDTRTPLRFSLVGEKAAAFDPQSSQAREFYALLRDHHRIEGAAAQVQRKPAHLAQPVLGAHRLGMRVDQPERAVRRAG